jgi:pyruvate decarboxylase
MKHAQQSTIPLGEYIFNRVQQLGIRSIFGVPGDYNLALLDFIEPSGLHWVGNCNELNAAYAADGYARIHGLSVVITTFGVGELSAINGIAGAYAERAPVIHIVGTPSRSLQSSRALVHHTFIDGEYRRFAAMYAHVTAAQVNLTDAETAPDQIDWIIAQAMIHQRPVYLQIPEDMADVAVAASNLTLRPVITASLGATAINPEHVAKILDRLHSAKQPVILVDGESRNIGALAEIDQLIRATGWPTWTSAFGKGLVDEELSNVHGVYLAEYGDDSSATYFKTADLVLFFGPHLSNINTHIFTAIPDEAVTIAFSPNQVRIDGHILRDVSSRGILAETLKSLDISRLAKVDGPRVAASSDPNPTPSNVLSQDLFYRFMNPIFRRGDVILTETGTAAEAGKTFKLPRGCRFFTAVTWLSIGYMLPAALGAALAQRDSVSHKGHNREQHRTFLFIGDGSFQMTAQELSTMIKENLNLVIVIINNNGYTIERVIHGRSASYNDISQWNHRHALGLFGLNDNDAAHRYFAARTWGELRTALDSESMKRENAGVTVIEAFMDQEDCTGELKKLLLEQISKEEGSM